MTRKRTPFGGRALAAVCLALALAGCASTYPGGLPLGASWPSGNGLTDGKPGTGEGRPSSQISQPPFVALYQTPIGPMALKGNRLYVLSASGVQEWGNAPRTSRAWSVWMIDQTEGWSVGEEGVSHFRNGIWVSYPSEVDSRMAPAVTGPDAIQLTDVAFEENAEEAPVGYAVGTHGTVLKFENDAWVSVTDPKFGERHFGTVRVVNPSNVWIGGEALLHYDGKTWESIALPSGVTAISGLLVVGDVVWVSTGEKLLRWDHLAKAWTDPHPTLVEGYVGPPLRVPGTMGDALAWALDVGTPGGALYRLNSGSWERVATVMPPNVGLDSLVMVDSDTGYAMAFDGSALYKYDQGTWSQVPF